MRFGFWMRICMREIFSGIPGKIITVALFFCLTSTRFSSGATPSQVDAAIKKAVAYLYANEQGDNWEVAKVDPHGFDADGGYSEASHFGGYTAIATYALLAAGEDPKDNPKLNAAINKILLDADIKSRLQDNGAMVSAMSIDEFTGFVRTEIEKYRGIIAKADLKAE